MPLENHAAFAKSLQEDESHGKNHRYTNGFDFGIAREGDRFAILAGDTGYNRASWEKLYLPGPVYNKENMEQALLWVHDLLEDDHCAGAYAAHDPAVAPGVYEF